MREHGEPGPSKLEQAIIAAGGPAAFKRWWDSIGDKAAKLRLAYDWSWRARPKQLPPPGEWSTWHLRAGRGFGKTRTGAEWIRHRVEKEGARRIALVAPTAADVRDVMVEGPSGILAVSPPWNRPKYEPSKRRLTWPNGAIATTFSADEPRSLRGPEYDSAWADELAHWKYLDEAWDNLQFGLRRGDPRCVVTSSPRALAFLRDLEKDPDTVRTIGSMYENEHNLPTKFLNRIRDKYEGTRLGRQEIHAEILSDNPAALWNAEIFEKPGCRVLCLPKEILRLVIGVDPAVSSNKRSDGAKKDSDETGIIGAALCYCECRGPVEKHAFVFDDQSGIYKPHEWGKKVVAFYNDVYADLVAAENNNGGELVERNIRATEGGQDVAYKAIHAAKGKEMRHEPVATLYERGKVHHVGRLSRLEDQMTQWDRTQGKSPDRLDAATIALTELMLTPERRVPEVRAIVIG